MTNIHASCPVEDCPGEVQVDVVFSTPETINDAPPHSSIVKPGLAFKVMPTSLHAFGNHHDHPPLSIINGGGE